MRAPAPAKLNLALVVGPTRPDGKHEVATVLQRVDLGDRVAVVPAPALTVDGFAGDTLVRRALEQLAAAAGVAVAFLSPTHGRDRGLLLAAVAGLSTVPDAVRILRRRRAS